MKRNQILPYRGLSNLKITTPNPLPGGQQGTAYSLTFAASGGQGNYQWFILHDYSGTGLTMSTSGVWSGTVASAGLAYIVVAVTDGVESIQQQFQVFFTNAVSLQITTSSPLPSGTVGVAYSQTLAAIGGTPPYTWSLLSQTGSNAWSVSTSGIVSGTPTVNETDTINIQVQDSLGATASKTFSLTVVTLSASNLIGTNIPSGGTAEFEYEGFPLFKNRIRENRGFLVVNTNGTYAALTSAGWPSVDFSTILFTGSLTGNTWYAGTWSCGFTTSAASPTVTGAGGASGTNMSISNLTNQGGGNWTFNATPTGPNFGFTVSGTTSAGGCTNVFAYLPEYNSNTSIDNPALSSAYTTEALAHYGQYNHIRWMWPSNVTYNVAQNTSATRRTLSNTQCQQGWPHVDSGGPVNTEGYPVEWGLNLAVFANTGLWLTLPMWEDGTSGSAGTYSTAVLNLIQSAIAGGWSGKVYLEIGNENWNGAYSCGFTGNSQANSVQMYLAITYGYSSAYGNSGFAGAQHYMGFRCHQLANLCRSILGASFGTQVSIVFGSQLGGGFTTYAAEIFPYMLSQGWTPSNDIQYCATAPYVNLTNNAGDNSVAAVEADLNAQCPNFPYLSGYNAEHSSIMAQHYGMKLIAYEGGWQVNSEASGNIYVGQAIMDSGMSTVMENVWSTMLNAGWQTVTNYEDGVSFGTPSSSNYTPVDNLSNLFPISTGNCPRFAALASFFGGSWTQTRNVVSGSGSTITAAYDNAAASFTNSVSIITPYSIGWQVYCTAPRVYSMEVSCNSMATQTVEVNGVVISTSFALNNGANSINVTLKAGFNYVLIGNGSYLNATVNSLSFT